MLRGWYKYLWYHNAQVENCKEFLMNSGAQRIKIQTELLSSKFLYLEINVGLLLCFTQEYHLVKHLGMCL